MKKARSRAYQLKNFYYNFATLFGQHSCHLLGHITPSASDSCPVKQPLYARKILDKWLMCLCNILISKGWASVPRVGRDLTEPGPACPFLLIFWLRNLINFPATVTASRPAVSVLPASVSIAQD